MNSTFYNKKYGRVKQRGFTLIELMIVVAIVAILTVVASTSYRNQVVRSNRAAAESFMLEIANREERYLLDARSYTDSLTNLGIVTPSEVSDNYSVDLDSSDSPPGYTITLTATGGQLSDDGSCSPLTLNQQGTKTPSGCWK